MSAPAKQVKINDGNKLKREINLFSAVNLIIGTMIGSGIFITPTSVLARSGSVGSSLIIWAIGGIITIINALTYAELGTLVPKSGGEYFYIKEAYKNLHPFWGPIPGFLYAFLVVFVLGPAGQTIGCLIFAEYVVQPFDHLRLMAKEDLQIVKKLIALCLVGLATYINCTSVKLFVRMQNTITISKLTVCLVVIIGGIYVLCIGQTDHFSNPFEGSNTSANSISLAFYSSLAAYYGSSIINVVVEELKKPEKDIPLSILISVPIVSGVYLMMNVAYMAVLSVPEMLAYPATGVEFGNRLLGPLNFIIPLGVAVSTFGTALNSIFASSRTSFVAAEEGHVFEILSYIQIDRLTPAPSVALHGFLMAVFIAIGNDVNVLIDMTGFVQHIFNIFSVGALFVMRFTKKNDYRPFKVPIIFPIISLLVSIFLAAIPLIMDPSSKFIAGAGTLVLGLMFYTPCIYYKKTPKKLIGKMNRFIQILMKVSPPEQDEAISLKN